MPAAGGYSSRSDEEVDEHSTSWNLLVKEWASEPEEWRGELVRNSSGTPSTAAVSLGTAACGVGHARLELS